MAIGALNFKPDPPMHSEGKFERKAAQGFRDFRFGSKADMTT
jgi:hypothetical protein